MFSLGLASDRIGDIFVEKDVVYFTVMKSVDPIIEQDLRTIKLEHNTLEEFVLREFGISSSHRCEFLISTVTETAKISAINFKDSDFEHVMLNPQNRLPTYEEMVSLKEIFWEQGEVTMQVHPAKSEYINIQKELASAVQSEIIVIMNSIYYRGKYG